MDEAAAAAPGPGPRHRAASPIHPAAAVLLLGCAAPLAFFALLAAGIWIAGWLKRPVEGQSEARSSVITGQGLAWRSVKLQDASKQQLDFHQVMPGDFDGDGSDELAVALFGTGQLHFSELDGGHLAALSARKQASSLRLVAVWDYDGDGTEEALAEDYSGSIQVYSMQGRVASLPYAQLGYRSAYGAYDGRGLLADADGDGSAELWVSDNANGDVVALGHSGRAVLNAGKASAKSFQLCDPDQDGKFELAWQDYGGAVLLAGAGGSRQFAQLPPETGLTACIDASGDGKPDLICGDRGYLDQAGQFVPFNQMSAKAHSIIDPGYVQFDLDGDALPELLCYDSDLRGGFGLVPPSPALRGFDPLSHKVEYEERFSGYPQGVCVCQASGTAHLVLATQDGILIYP